MTKAIITVLGKDRVGITAGVCAYLAENNINILDISQTITDGWFNMIMITDVGGCEKHFSLVSEELKRLGMTLGVSIHSQLEDIFTRMHRI